MLLLLHLLMIIHMLHPMFLLMTMLQLLLLLQLRIIHMHTWPLLRNGKNRYFIFFNIDFSSHRIFTKTNNNDSFL